MHFDPEQLTDRERALLEAAEALNALLSPSQDLQELRSSLMATRTYLDYYELRALASLRHYGSSWGDLAAPMGMSRQGVQARYDRLMVSVLEANFELPPWAVEGGL